MGGKGSLAAGLNSLQPEYGEFNPCSWLCPKDKFGGEGVALYQKNFNSVWLINWISIKTCMTKIFSKENPISETEEGDVL